MAQHYKQAELVAMLAYQIGSMFIKIALLTSYIRLSYEKRFRQAVQLMSFFSVVTAMHGVIFHLAKCRPIRKIWDHGVPGTCNNTSRNLLAQAAMALIADVAIFILPL